MKKILFLICAILSLSSLAISLGPVIKGSEIKTQSEQKFKGKTYLSTITKKDIEHVPAWTPGKTACPLDMISAVEIVKSYLTKKFPEVKDWEVFSIKLTQIEIVAREKEDDNITRWIYEITFRTKAEEFAGLMTYDYLTISVSLSGWMFTLEDKPPGKDRDLTPAKD